MRFKFGCKFGILLVVSLIAHMAFLVLGTTVLSEWRWPHHAVHSSAEIAGAFAALWCAWMLVWLERRNTGTSFNIFIAGAMVGMGLLDGFHALCHAGNNFVWLHSTATFLGGILFSLVWLKRWWTPSARWPWLVALGTTLVAGGSLVWPELVPKMVQDGNFTFTAMSLNVVGGILMFVAAAQLAWSHKKKANEDDLLFCLHCTLFGLAAIMFEQSSLWDLPWWGWHFLRLAAYVVAVGFIVLNNPERDLFKLNELLRKHKSSLELTVKARTSDLVRANEALRKKESQAKAASLAKSEFLANMSHEIRTPMTAILGYSDILLGEDGLKDASEEHRMALQTIRENGKYLLNIINDILDLSKIEAGRFEIEKLECSPCEIVTDVATLMEVRAAAKGLPLEFTLDGPVPETIHSDPTRLRQILVNLVGNAIKFTETGSVQIVTRLLEEPGEEPKLQFSVIDTGIGIPVEGIKKLFQPFTQADSSTSRRFGGTGLGLTISKRLSELLGGNISVASTLGTGSTFSITVATGPIDRSRMTSNAIAMTTEKPRHNSAIEGASPLINLRILLAEDGPDNQRLISFILKRAGAEVTLAENGQVALDLATEAADEGHPYDVILMDMQMPVLDGYTATKKLRSQGYTGPIVALTAHAMATDRQICIEAGCSDYATKPINRDKLLSLIVEQTTQPQIEQSHV